MTCNSNLNGHERVERLPRNAQKIPEHSTKRKRKTNKPSNQAHLFALLVLITSKCGSPTYPHTHWRCATLTWTIAKLLYILFAVPIVSFVMSSRRRRRCCCRRCRRCRMICHLLLFRRATSRKKARLFATRRPFFFSLCY